MSTDRQPRGSWRRGLGIVDWPSRERPYAQLLDALMRERLDEEAAQRQRDASARRSMEDIYGDQAEIAEEELTEARRELDLFRAALEDLWARSGGDVRSAVPYDDRDPIQNDYADALIQYLVRPGFAEVSTEEPEPGHYVYFIRVDWDRLAEVARERGAEVPLFRA